jgi:hypothetical protein
MPYLYQINPLCNYIIYEYQRHQISSAMWKYFQKCDIVEREFVGSERQYFSPYNDD